jgi:hypothetical protein
MKDDRFFVVGQIVNPRFEVAGATRIRSDNRGGLAVADVNTAAIVVAEILIARVMSASVSQ